MVSEWEEIIGLNKERDRKLLTPVLGSN